MSEPTCPQCGSVLEPPGAYGRKRVYCSPECGDKYRRARRGAAPSKSPGRCSPTTVDVQYTAEELEVLKEVDRYRRRNGYRSLAVGEIVRVLLAMGYSRAK